MKRTIINAEGYEIEVRFGGQSGDFVSLTDIARYKTAENPGYVIQNWMRNRNTVRFLGLWEQFHNPVFNYLEFEAIEKEAGLNSFVLTPKRWIEATQAIGMVSKQGRYHFTLCRGSSEKTEQSLTSPMSVFLALSSKTVAAHRCSLRALERELPVS